jgi:transposase
MRRADASKTTVWRWQERYMTEGVAGLLRDKTRPSRIPPLTAEVERDVVSRTLAAPPGETTYWTAPAMAKVSGISVSSVQRIWRKHGLQPHRMRQFKLSNDPQFAAKLHDIVGLYVDPPGARRRAVDRRKEPDPGARSHPARLADEERPLWNHDARLQAARYHHTVCRSQCAGWPRDRPLHAAASPPGVHPLPQRH